MMPMPARTPSRARLWQIARSLPLALCAAVAVRQSIRTRRALAEATLPEQYPLPEPSPHVSIVLPVRDEEANIDAVLGSLLAQDYPSFDLLVVDDGSTDATPRLLAAWAARDPRVRVHRIDALPAGWAGKTHALHTGASRTEGEWLLFTDADTRHAPATLRRMVGHAQGRGDDLVSMLAQPILTGAGTRLLTPTGALTLFERATPAEVRDPAHPGAIAVGQYILVRRAAYDAIGGYAAPGLRDTFADDVLLAERVKREGWRVDLVSGRDLVSNEQWPTWGGAWRGWRKSIYGATAGQPGLTTAGGVALVGYGLLPLITAARALVARRWVAGSAAAAILALQIDARAQLDRAFRLPRAWSLAAPAGWVALGLVILDAARLHLAGRAADWKGRAAPPQAAPREA
jgi:chlorobactene glucosyltransferase